MKEKVYTTNYYDTFIEVSEDCKAEQGRPPVSKSGGKSVAERQYEIISRHPYRYTSDEVLFQVYADRQDLTPGEYDEARKSFFSKGQACFRASPLPKQYGFGLHFDAEGKVALYGRETDIYQQFLDNPAIKKVKGMRGSRKK